MIMTANKPISTLQRQTTDSVEFASQNKRTSAGLLEQLAAPPLDTWLRIRVS
jgi:hypothetical protein